MEDAEVYLSALLASTVKHRQEEDHMALVKGLKDTAVMGWANHDPKSSNVPVAYSFELTDDNTIY